EGGLSGAEKWRPQYHDMESRFLVNLDTPETQRIAVQSAGFQYVNATLDPDRESGPAGSCYKLSLSGLAGGHSGDHIGQNRGNAIMLMGNLLKSLPAGSRVVSFTGG